MLNDSLIVKTKGITKATKHQGAKNKKCTQCFQPGHTQQTYQLNPLNYVHPNKAIAA